MKLSTFKSFLSEKTNITFSLPSGDQVPSHFHITEIGQIDKRFIDCGGTLRKEAVISFQLWEANDYDHRLEPNKLAGIISLAEKELQLEDLEIEVEHQGDTIQKYGLDVHGDVFLLTVKQTDCLAKDACGVTPQKIKISMSELGTPDNTNTCTPGGGCC